MTTKTTSRPEENISLPRKYPSREERRYYLGRRSGDARDVRQRRKFDAARKSRRYVAILPDESYLPFISASVLQLAPLPTRYFSPKNSLLKKRIPFEKERLSFVYFFFSLFFFYYSSPSPFPLSSLFFFSSFRKGFDDHKCVRICATIYH